LVIGEVIDIEDEVVKLRSNKSIKSISFGKLVSAAGSKLYILSNKRTHQHRKGLPIYRDLDHLN